LDAFRADQEEHTDKGDNGWQTIQPNRKRDVWRASERGTHHVHDTRTFEPGDNLSVSRALVLHREESDTLSRTEAEETEAQKSRGSMTPPTISSPSLPDTQENRIKKKVSNARVHSIDAGIY
jgi:hypothetical protein